MQIGIVGSRTFNDYQVMVREVNLDNATGIVSGGAIGADTLAERLAHENNLPMTVFKPDYKQFGRSAPFKRNTQIIEASDIVIAFWDGRSTGTLDSIKKARLMGKQLKIVYYNQPTGMCS